MVNPRDNNIFMIDGSYGEGGGQVLRTSLALSCALGKPFEIINIRRERQKPGLQPQHLTAVKAAAAISRARVVGAELSSTELRFSPDEVSGGDYFFDVSEKKGSAGSVTLVLQTALLPLCFADRPSTITVAGGTHVPWSPSFHYLQHVFIPTLSRLGARVDARLERWGWYPAGGGRVAAGISPLKKILPLSVTDRGALVRMSGISAASNLPEGIAVRQRDRAARALLQRGLEADIRIVPAPSPGKGTFLFVLAEFEKAAAGFGALGAIGKRAEEVADESCRELFAYLDGGGALDPRCADQIIPYLALAQGTSEFTTSKITRHLLTNIHVVKQFLDADIIVRGNEGEAGLIVVKGKGVESIVRTVHNSS
jgi:RNA 3'-terminal phosphate cyclase (ATP)